ncbi:hypothetical protein IMPERIA89_420025 [Imperialibacter sp. 89]|nr:hypothetical protein IMPERIA89_420025 [Imperialibacter sp. 89]CAD5295267.1 hypothetical protein IMPERIA75_690025 [Imperialibacter sp. 75]
MWEASPFRYRYTASDGVLWRLWWSDEFYPIVAPLSAK